MKKVVRTETFELSEKKLEGVVALQRRVEKESFAPRRAKLEAKLEGLEEALPVPGRLAAELLSTGVARSEEYSPCTCGKGREFRLGFDGPDVLTVEHFVRRCLTHEVFFKTVGRKASKEYYRKKKESMSEKHA